ncbi:RteC domain-containing protein [Sphingobacterium corticibacter]
MYKIETKKPYGTKPIRKYLNKELKKLKRFFDNKIDFYKYYRSRYRIYYPLPMNTATII